MSTPYNLAYPQQNPYVENTSSRKKRTAILIVAFVTVFLLATTISYILFSRLSSSELAVGNVDDSRRIIERVETNYPYTSDSTEYQPYPAAQRTYYASNGKAQKIFPILSNSDFYEGTPQYEQALSVSGSYVYSFTTVNRKATTAQEMKDSSDPVLHYSLSIVETAPEYQYGDTNHYNDISEDIARILDSYYDYDAIQVICVPEEDNNQYRAYRPYEVHILKDNTLTNATVTHTGTLAFITADTVNLNTEAGIENALPKNDYNWDIVTIRNNIYNKSEGFVDIRKDADETLEYATAAKDLSDDELLKLLESAPVHSTDDEYIQWPSNYTNSMATTDDGYMVMTVDGQVQEGSTTIPVESLESAKPFIADFNNDGIRDIVAMPFYYQSGIGDPESGLANNTTEIVVYTPTLDGKGLEILTTGKLLEENHMDKAEELFLQKHPNAEKNDKNRDWVEWRFREYNLEDKEVHCSKMNVEMFPEECPTQTIDSTDPIVISAENSEIKVNLLRGLPYKVTCENADYCTYNTLYKHYTGTFTLGDDGKLHLTDIE